MRAAPRPAAVRVGNPAAVLLGLQRRIGNRATTMVVQRATTREVWDGQIEPRLKARTVADFDRDQDHVEVKVAKKAADDYWFKAGGGKPAAIADLNTFLAGHTWGKTLSPASSTDPVSFAGDAELHSNVDLTQPTIGLDVQDIEGDKHNLLHYTTTPYNTPEKKKEPSQSREQGHHLTVENAHLLFLLTLQEDKTLEFLDKTTLDKPKINELLNARGAAGIDNLNFFPRDQSSRPLANRDIPPSKLKTMDEPSNEALDESLSLDVYMRFAAKVAQELPGVPAVYGLKMLHSLQVMRQLTGLDPSQMFLKVGKGDQRQVLRTLVTISSKGLAPNLKLPDDTMATFARWILPKPYLPAKEPVGEDTEWIVEAGLGRNSVRYNDLEPVYVAKHYPGAIAALRTYLG